ncbi:hypothetical protein JEQ12_020243 [Ovis aries]|uniref:Uncharacterized protein n=1 Tax=Ovis aries TaxID=9940 RepID=A0A835ZKX1_SHEEP|nr:hypothetical protein JEQ12_020243 [Ovis aries]
MAAKKSCNAVCFKDERKKEDPLSMEIQRQCEGTKNDHEVQKTSTRNPEKENLIIFHSVEEGEENKKAKVFFSVPVHARNMTMRVRRPLKGTLRKKIRSHATPSKKVKNTREPNCFLRSCAREKLNQAEKGTKYDHEGQKTSKRNLEKENPIARHSVEEGTKYDHEGQKTSKRNLEKENPIARHSVEEGEEHKRTKLFLRSCAREKLNQAEKGTKYDHEGQKTSKRNLEKENPIARHSVEEGEEHKRTKLFLRSCAREKLNQAEKGTKYDHEGQKTSKRNLEKENPIVRHSVEEGEENKRTKLFSPFPCT